MHFLIVFYHDRRKDPVTLVAGKPGQVKALFDYMCKERKNGSFLYSQISVGDCKQCGFWIASKTFQNPAFSSL